jgi:HEAT repeat protein
MTSVEDLQRLLDRFNDRGRVSIARRGALTAYVRARGPDATQLCLTAMDDPEPSIRRQALRLLGERPDAAAVEPLIERLDGGDIQSRRQILATLGRMGQSSARPAIERLCDAEDFFVRSEARRALHQLDVPTAAPPPLEVRPAEAAEVQTPRAPAAAGLETGDAA